ncbi:MAG: cytochrome c3 family protein, partial [Candidatus Latescibacteria bacterium]|nr:cytochrome c3 family protein [Candidatus Latescibacterota bacterium]
DEIEIFSLPYLDIQALDDQAIGQWPEDAAGEMTPFMKLLLSASPAVADDLKRLSETGIYLDDLSEADEASMKAAVRIVWAIKTLVYNLTTQERNDPWQLVQEGNGLLSNRDRASLAEQFPIDAIRAAQSRWLPELESEIRRYRAGEVVDTTPFFVNMDELVEADAPVGWSFEMSEFVGRYGPTGHADGILRKWLDVTGRLYYRSDEAEEIFDLLRGAFSSGRCIVCHSTNDRENREDAITQNQFRKIDWPEMQLPFTRFTHRPHLDQTCGACHHGEGFAPGITEETCASCHTPEKAGDSCLACHNYHMGNFSLAREAGR